jgi:hypothetical protein
MSTPPINSSKNSALPTPFSLRLTFDERAALEKAAGNKPLGVCIRAKLFEGNETPCRVRTRSRKPLEDERALGRLLGELGRARLANNLNQLAKAVNTSSLPVTPDTKKPSMMPVLQCRICVACSCRHWASNNLGALDDLKRKSALRRQAARNTFAKIG